MSRMDSRVFLRFIYLFINFLGLFSFMCVHLCEIIVYHVCF